MYAAIGFGALCAVLLALYYLGHGAEWLSSTEIGFWPFGLVNAEGHPGLLMLSGLLALALLAFAGVVAFFGAGALWLIVWVGLPALGAWVSAQLVKRVS